MGDLGGGQVEKAIDDFADVALDPRDGGSVAVCGCFGGTFRELREFGFVGGSGCRIVEFEQGGKKRAEYGQMLLERLSADLTAKFGRGLSLQNLYKYRQFFLTFPEILPTVSGEFTLEKLPTLSGESPAAGAQSLPAQLRHIAARFPLPWSHYVRLLGLRSEAARKFYETEALRGGWSVRQLDRQISTQFYERTALSRNKAAMLRKSGKPEAGDAVSPDEEIKDPFVLEFLGLKDEYSESDLEDAQASGKRHCRSLTALNFRAALCVLPGGAGAPALRATARECGTRHAGTGSPEYHGVTHPG